MNAMASFTCVPQKSLEAFWRNQTLEEALSALLADPEEAADLAEKKARKLPRLEQFARDGAKSVDAALITVSEWSMVSHDAATAIRQITSFDYRLGMWCGAAMVHSAIGVDQDGAVARELEAIRGFVAGQVGREALVSSLERIRAASDQDAPWRALIEAAGAVARIAMTSFPEDRSLHAYNATVRVASVLERETGVVSHQDLRVVRRVRALRSVVASACWSFPWHGTPKDRTTFVLTRRSKSSSREPTRPLQSSGRRAASEDIRRGR